VIALSQLEDLGKIRDVEMISIKEIEGHSKKILKIRKEKPGFFCVKMTLAIQVENISGGMQEYEERYVVLKASSFEDAYQRIENNKDEYNYEPYLNSAGYFVRWKIESLDDCYAIYVDNIKDFNNPAGVEVYSTLKRRKLTPEREWNGKADN
jgi:hypothetical protein